MGAPLRILVVDDNEAVRLVLTELLTDLGHQVVAEAESGEAAHKMYAEHKPDLVTLDLSLSASPGGDGLSVLKALRGADAKAQVIIISGNCQEKVKKAAEDAGAMAFVSKPINAAALATAVAKAIPS